MVTVYVGNPHQTSKISKDNLWYSPILDKNVSHDPSIGPYIMLPLLLNIDPGGFKVVAGLMSDISFACTEPLRLAKAFAIAKNLEMGSIAQLCWRRFRRVLMEPPAELLVEGTTSFGRLRQDT